MDVICNPPFDLAHEYINLLIDAWKLNKKTRALVILPHRPANPYYETLEKDPRFE